MKKAEGYIKRIEAAKSKNEIEGIRIEFSQDGTMAWEHFMECYNAYRNRKRELGL